jgi:hypothetical protein
MVEPLLCYDCEQKISAFEDYAKRFFYGSSDPIRLSLPLLPDPVFTADYRKMKLFQLSILWRAAAEAKRRVLFCGHLDGRASGATAPAASHRKPRSRSRILLHNGSPRRVARRSGVAKSAWDIDRNRIIRTGSTSIQNPHMG